MSHILIPILLFAWLPSYGEENHVREEVPSKPILIFRIKEESLSTVQVAVELGDSNEGNISIESLVQFKDEKARLEHLAPYRKEVSIEDEIEEAIIKEEEESYSERPTRAEIFYVETEIFDVEKMRDRQKSKFKTLGEYPSAGAISFEDLLKKLMLYNLVRHIDKHYGEQIEAFLDRYPYIEVFSEAVELKDGSIVVHIYAKEF